MTSPRTLAVNAPSAAPNRTPELARTELEAACALLGVFPLPVGLLLLPPAPGDEARAETALRALAQGDATTPMPHAWAFLRAALDGDAARAHDLAATAPEPWARYNRLVLGADPELARSLTAPHALPSPLAELAAAAAFVHGLHDTAPDLPDRGIPDNNFPEATAVVAMIRAAAELETGRTEGALAELGHALDAVRTRSPVFAAQLAAQRADLLRAEPQAAVLELRAALELARGSTLPGQRSALHLQLGLLLHDLAEGRRGLLLEAVKAYQNALQEGLADHPTSESFALVQNHLGLAYLAMPMDDQAARLRLGVAVQSFRKALEVYRPETHPELWASTQMNLANSLQYLPSSHPQENLVQAVELYEQLLQVRTAAKDPLGYARVLANQANALAHLGMFSPALAKLEEAHKLFHWHGEPDLAASVLEQVAAIHRRRQDADEEGTVEVENDGDDDSTEGTL
ncbi:MAG: hypothetical protein AAGC60_07335 [Acidobacteriota bacterium]